MKMSSKKIIYVASRHSKCAALLRRAVGSAGSVEDYQIEELHPGKKIGEGLVDETDVAKIPQIEVLFAETDVIAQVITHPSMQVKWAHSTFAGVEPVIKAVEKLNMGIPNFLLTRHTDGFGQDIGEFIIGQIISRERNFPHMFELQKKKVYSYHSPLLCNYRSLSEIAVGILGLGNIGSEVARQCSALNMTVWATVRDEKYSDALNSEHVHHFRPFSRLHEMLEQCDYLINILPSAPTTRGLLGNDVLKSCQNKKTVFINVGRGDVIDDESLIKALSQNWLGGAILDVYNTEPLPADSPLWSMSGVTISPHVSGLTHVPKAVQMFVENLRRYTSGKPLINLVDWTRGY